MIPYGQKTSAKVSTVFKTENVQPNTSISTSFECNSYHTRSSIDIYCSIAVSFFLKFNCYMLFNDFKQPQHLNWSSINVYCLVAQRFFLEFNCYMLFNDFIQPQHLNWSSINEYCSVALSFFLKFNCYINQFYSLNIAEK